MIPEFVADAARYADKDEVAAWLDEHPQTVNDVDTDGTSLLHVCLAKDGNYDANRLDLVKYLISRGADVNRIAVGEENEGICPLHLACGGKGTFANKFVVLLIGAGSQVNRRVAGGEFMDLFGALTQVERSPLGAAIDNFLCDRGHSGKLAMVCTLLRAGASLDNCAGDNSAEELVTAEEQYKNLIKGNWHFAALKTVIKDVSAAGSWKKYCRRRGPHREILALRSLAMRGYITPYPKRHVRGADWKAAVAFVSCLGDNGVVWNILSFWRDPDDIEDIAVDDDDEIHGGDVVRVYV